MTAQKKPVKTPTAIAAERPPPALPPDGAAKKVWVNYHERHNPKGRVLGSGADGNVRPLKSDYMAVVKEWHASRVVAVAEAIKAQDDAAAGSAIASLRSKDGAATPAAPPAAKDHGAKLNDERDELGGGALHEESVTESDQLMNELTTKLLEFGINSAVVLGIVEQSGATSLDEFRELDDKALNILITRDGVSMVAQSKMRKHFLGKENMLGNINGALGARTTRKTTRIVDPLALKPKPKHQEYKTWRESTSDWYKAHVSQDFDAATLYLALQKGIPEEDRQQYYHTIDSENRNCVTLLAHLDDAYARMASSTRTRTSTTITTATAVDAL
jgi:hypothetical protein